MDRDYSCYTLPRNLNLSDHNAVCFARQTPTHDENRQLSIPASSTQHPDFAKRVQIEVTHLLAKDMHEPTAFRKLVLTKEAVWTVHKGIAKESSQLDEEGKPRGHTSEVG